MLDDLSIYRALIMDKPTFPCRGNGCENENNYRVVKNQRKFGTRMSAIQEQGGKTVELELMASQRIDP
jgi:hypothetical protein